MLARRLAILAAAFVPALAQAIVTADGSNPPLPGGLSLAGVGALSNGCSTVLLEGGGWLLGSAHCAAGAGATVSFAGGATAAIVEVVFAPEWLPAQQVAVNDLSLMRLASPPPGIAGYAVASPPSLGSAFVLAGYGAGGNGTSGGDLPAGTLRYGFNQYDRLLADAPPVVYGGRVLAFDFDDGSAASNRSGSTGLGVAEGMLAGLDSGGPSFVWQGGTWVIGGIHTGIAKEFGTQFGGVGFDIVPGHYQEWIQQVTAVPSPPAGGLAFAGLALVMLAGGARSIRRRLAPVPSLS